MKDFTNEEILKAIIRMGRLDKLEVNETQWWLHITWADIVRWLQIAFFVGQGSVNEDGLRDQIDRLRDEICKLTFKSKE